MRIECDIDEMVLEGFDPLHRHRIADAVERALEEGLAGPSPASSVGSRASAAARADATKAVADAVAAMVLARAGGALSGQARTGYAGGETQ